MNQHNPNIADTDFVPIMVTWGGSQQFLFPQHPLVVDAYARAAHNRPPLRGEDVFGEFVIIPLGNTVRSAFCGHVFLVSPADEVLAREHNWCAYKAPTNGDVFVCWHRGQRDAHVLLSRQLAAMWFDPVPKTLGIYGHNLDFRRGQVRPRRKPKDQYYGIVKKDNGYQAQTGFSGKNEYIGQAKTKIEAARIYNDALRAEKVKRADNRRHPIHWHPYNDVTPRFTDGDDRRGTVTLPLGHPTSI